VEVEDLVLAVFNIDGMFFVTDDQCTHGPGSLSEGDILAMSSNATSTMAPSTCAPERSRPRPA
jgi:hypothetical protein